MHHDHIGEPGAYRTRENGQSPEETMQDAPLIIHTDQAEREHDTEGAHDEASLRPWRAEMARWLLTLNPGRTQDEYAKAVGYFFETTGVPQDLDDLTSDLLLAYRGSLAMRAERAHTRRSARATVNPGAARQARLWGHTSHTRTLPGNEASDMSSAPHQTGPLAPATVNIRLTALRQFLRHASLQRPLSGLTIERMQMALRRLPIERRRPYQILSEEEWPAFLAVARMPLDDPRKTPESTSPASANVARSQVVSPWGRTRAERQRARQEDVERLAQATDTHSETSDETLTDAIDSHMPPARDGRTGARTAQRDYALVAFALATGLRAIELSLLDVGDLTHERRHGRDEWWLTLPDEKTKGQRGGRILPIAPELVETLLSYIQSTGRSLHSASDRATPLFLALPRGPHADAGDGAPAAAEGIFTRRLRPEQIRSVINRIETQWIALQRDNADSAHYGGEARRISPHALRHSAAIALLKGNETTGRPPASVEHVRGWLGHFDIRTTQRYLDHLSSREERRKFTITPPGFQATPPQRNVEASPESSESSVKEEE
jgi:integrase